MPRIAKQPIDIPEGVNVELHGNELSIKGKLGVIVLPLHRWVDISQKNSQLSLSIVATSKKNSKPAWAQAATARAIINNSIQGVVQGCDKKLVLNGVGYRAQVRGKVLNLMLGYSHPIDYPIPEGITIETPSQTEITVKGFDKQKVGQVAAEIREFRPPEPYKGKGVRYTDERIVRKETKKK